MTPVEAPSRIELDVGGMTCASCAARVERELNKLGGVSASVNYATELASVAYDPRAVRPPDLVRAVEEAGYTAALPADAGAKIDVSRALQTRMLVSSALTVPLLLLAMVPPLQFNGWEWVAFALATPIVLWAGLPFHRAAVLNARHLTATMDTLVSLGTLAAWGWSVVVLLAGLDADVYFEVAGVITTLILAGRFLEARARRRSGAAIRALLELGAKEARLLRDGAELLVPVDQLQVGDSFVVRPGEKIATDGAVVEGESAVDQSMLTGESMPVEVELGAELAGATINTYGRLVVRATKVGAETALAQIARLVAEAQGGKAPIQRLVDRISGVFVPVVLVIAFGTLAGWLAVGASVSDSFTAAVAVLIIACPCALGLATPTALLVGTGRGAQLGILIKGPEVLEQTRRVGTIILDKTGTVTAGKMALVDVAPLNGASRLDVLRFAGAVEAARRASGRSGDRVRCTRGDWKPAACNRFSERSRHRRAGNRRGTRRGCGPPWRSDHRVLGWRGQSKARRRGHAQADEPRSGARVGGARAQAGALDRRRRAHGAAHRGRGRDRAGDRRGAAGRESRRGSPLAGRGRGRRDGR